MLKTLLALIYIFTLCAVNVSAQVYGDSRYTTQGRHTILPPASGTYFALWADPNCCGSQANAINNLEGEIDTAAGVSNFRFFGHLSYWTLTNLSGVNSDSNVSDDISKGRVPILALGFGCTGSGTTNTGVTFRDIASGMYDTQLTSDFNAIGALANDSTGRPARVELRDAWEFNGNITNPATGGNGNNCFYGPNVALDEANGNDAAECGEYVAAWRHEFNLAASLGVKNITWMWNPAGNNVTITNSLSGVFLDIRPCYPGDQYVDWVGYDGYDKSAVGLTVLYSTAVNIYKANWPQKPLAILETAECNSNGPCNSVSHTVWSQSQYFADITTNFETGGTWANLIKQINWFGSCPASCVNPTGFNWTVDNPLDTSGPPDGLQSMANMVTSVFFSPAVPSS